MGRMKEYIEESIIEPTALRMVAVSDGAYDFNDMHRIAWEHFNDSPTEFDPEYLVGVSAQRDW